MPSPVTLDTEKIGQITLSGIALAYIATFVLSLSEPLGKATGFLPA